jgi:hypothetical protein
VPFPSLAGLRVRASAWAVLGLPQRLKPRAFSGLLRHELTRALPEPMVTDFGDTCHDYAREGHDFQSCRKGVIRHAALAAEGQLSSLNPGYAEQ